MIWQKFLLYGFIGMQIEVLFTGIYSMFKRHWKLTGHTYLYMGFVYGAAALVLEAVSNALPWPFWAKAFVYVPIIYGFEALSGWTIKSVTGWLQTVAGGTGGGVIPWEYAKSRWTLQGLIEPRYAPLWLALGMAFDPISGFLRMFVAYLTANV